MHYLSTRPVLSIFFTFVRNLERFRKVKGWLSLFMGFAYLGEEDSDWLGQHCWHLVARRYKIN